MKVKNPYSRDEVDYPIDLDAVQFSYMICHETVFSPFFSEWKVSVLESGDVIYYPGLENKSRFVYIVTPFFLRHEVDKMHGIFCVPLFQFTMGDPTPGDEDDEDEDLYDSEWDDVDDDDWDGESDADDDYPWGYWNDDEEDEDDET